MMLFLLFRCLSVTLNGKKTASQVSMRCTDVKSQSSTDGEVRCRLLRVLKLNATIERVNRKWSIVSLTGNLVQPRWEVIFRHLYCKNSTVAFSRLLPKLLKTHLASVRRSRSATVVCWAAPEQREDIA